MGQPVVHFEIIGSDPALLRRYYGQLGGTVVLGPARNERGGVMVGHSLDPTGNLAGVAGPL